jgi:hypothetical protein
MTIKKRKPARKKRVLSAAQKAALARGRKKAAANRKRKTSTRKPAAKRTVRKKVKRVVRRKSPEPVVIIHQGEKVMAKRKRRRRTSAVTTTRRRRSRGRYMGSFGIGNKGKRIQGMVMDTAVSTASAIGGTMILAKVPMTNAKLKSTLPLISGIVVGIMAKGKNAKVMANISNGLMIAGGLAIVKQFAPQFALAGENEMYRQNSLLGVNTDMLGINTDVVDSYNEGDLSDL